MNLKLAALLKSKIFIACASSVAAVTTAVAVAVAVNQPDAYRMIKIFDLIGSATIERSGIGELDAYTEMNLESGDIVDVHDGSTMHLNLDDDKYIQLDGGTRLELIATGTASDSLTTINLMEGTILNEITSPLSESSSYTVNTPKSTMAVRGTSFVVSVEQNPDGSYMTNLYAFHGVVEVQLIDEEGNPKGETVQVLEDQAVAIMTTQNDATTNDANIDGFSFFVVEDGEDGTYRPVSEGESPVTGFDYNDIPESMLRQALSTNNNNEISLDDVVLQEILNALNGDQSSISGNDAVSDNEAEEAFSDSVSNNGAETSDATISDNTVSENEASENEIPITTSENSISENSASENSVSRNTVSRNTTSQNTVTTTTNTSTTENSSNHSSGSSSGATTETEEEVEYTVTFVGRNGEILATETVLSGESATAPSVESPVEDTTIPYTRYLFTDWDSDFSNVTSDITVTAQYEAMVHVVSYSARNVSSGEFEIIGTQNVTDRLAADPSEFSISSDPFTIGSGENAVTYQFTSWAYSGSGISSDTTIEASYTSHEACAVTFEFFDSDGNEASQTYYVPYGKTLAEAGYTAPSVTTYEKEENGITREYTFAGWDTDTTQAVTTSLTITARYDVGEIKTVTLVAYNGSSYETFELAPGSTYTLPTVDANSGWILATTDSSYNGANASSYITQYTPDYTTRPATGTVTVPETNVLYVCVPYAYVQIFKIRSTSDIGYYASYYLYGSATYGEFASSLGYTITDDTPVADVNGNLLGYNWSHIAGRTCSSTYSNIRVDAEPID